VIGLVVALFFTLHHSYRNSYHLTDSISTKNGVAIHHIRLAEEVSFFNKASIIQALDAIPANSKVIIDCTKCRSIAYDVQEYIYDFPRQAKIKNISVETINFIPPKSLLAH
jgi:SulP family sulfate permease